MPDTNFHLAPPVKTVDGLLAVPIDIQKITASLTFDGATESGSGDATIEFIMGPQDGNPIFDLRQTITEAWLDGTSLTVSKVVHHDFGGGPHAQMRVLESVLAAGSTHTLRVVYTLGTPQSSMAGSYLPAVTWGNGPRLDFNFGFTDLGAGRYLEAWVPANLIFDQFELVLTLQVLNTSIAHTVITNGTVTILGTNHWFVAFPSYYTAFSPMLELRANDTLTNMTDTVLLPVSGTVTSIEVWKLVSNPTDLTTQVNNLKTWLIDNENSVGPYIHGNRFVAFLNVGGMEYDGGTTSHTSSLRHETFHSWCGRGLKPASQPDAWWDEAWTVYNDNGAIGSFPFDFSEPPVVLCPGNPWKRVTAQGSYDSGNRFWEGTAALIGVNNLKNLMSDFYDQKKDKPVATTDLEEFLVCHSGNPQLVDAFHRFIYGYNDPTSAPDLWIRDDPTHGGSDYWGGRFWDSPDLWIRNNDDNGTAHQSPLYGQDNWFYARVHNRSTTATANHFLVSFCVKSFAGTEFLYPADFLPCSAAASGFDLGPGESTIVKALWPANLVPAPGTHGCLLAAVLTRFDHPVTGRHVWENNNLAQKNLTVIGLTPNAWIVIPFVVSNLVSLRVHRFRLQIIRPKNQTKLSASLISFSNTKFKAVSKQKIKHFSSRLSTSVNSESPNLDCSGFVCESNIVSNYNFNRIITSDNTDTLALHIKDGNEVFFSHGRSSQISISLGPQDQRLLGLRLTVPKDAKPGEIYRVDLVKRNRCGKHILGGLAVEIHVC